MNTKTPMLIRKKINHNNFSQSKILVKSCFNDSNRISTIPKGTIVNVSDASGTNLRELLNHMKAKNK